MLSVQHIFIFIFSVLILSGCGKGKINHNLLNTGSDESELELNVNIMFSDYSENFDLPELESLSQKKKMRLWATHYNTSIVKESEKGKHLRNKKGKSLGVKLSRKDWCSSAMGGSVIVILKNGEEQTFTYSTQAKGHPVNCKKFYSHDTSLSKFAKTKNKFGEASTGDAVRPYRTIAVDNRLIKKGTVLYIPSARGNEIILPDGSITNHDGYFYAIDVGGAIKNSHIDIYLGVTTKNPFSWIKHDQKGKFNAYIVNDKKITKYMKKIHLSKK